MYLLDHYYSRSGGMVPYPHKVGVPCRELRYAYQIVDQEDYWYLPLL